LRCALAREETLLVQLKKRKGAAVAMETKLQDKLKVLVDRDKARELEMMPEGFIVATNCRGGLLNLSSRPTPKC
jgi:hypothetical protein